MTNETATPAPKCTSSSIASALAGPMLSVLTDQRARLLLSAVEEYAATLANIYRDSGGVLLGEQAEDLAVLAAAIRQANAHR